MRVLWNFFSVSVFCKVFMPHSVFQISRPSKWTHQTWTWVWGPFCPLTEHTCRFGHQRCPYQQKRFETPLQAIPRNFHFQTFYNLLAEQGFRNPRRSRVVCWVVVEMSFHPALLTKNAWNLRYKGVQKSSFFFWNAQMGSLTIPAIFPPEIKKFFAVWRLDATSNAVRPNTS